MGFAGILIASIIVGILAQAWKGRTGALWGLLTFGLGLPWIFFLSLVMTAGEISGEFKGIEDDALNITRFIAAFFPTLVVMGLIVATIPKRSRKDQ